VKIPENKVAKVVNASKPFKEKNCHLLEVMYF
jgi:hypothetical protein